MNETPNTPPPIPDPEKLQPSGLSNKHKRWIFFAIMGVVALIILANVVGTNPPASPARQPQTAKLMQQNPSPAQIRDWESSLKQQQAQIEESTRRAQQATAAPAATLEDLQRAAALEDAARLQQQHQQSNGSAAGQQNQAGEQLRTEREQRAYKSLFADSVVHQERASSPQGEQRPQQPTSPPPPTETPRIEPVNGNPRKALDFDPAKQRDYWLPEGTVIEAVLTNRLDGDAPGPVNCMVTTDVYLPDTRLLVIPQGARVLGEASKVSSFGQQRLAVAFHRVLVPGLNSYSIPLDKEPPALAQAGEVGLHDKVNSHYVSIFGASLAIGAIGGLAQIGNGVSGFGYDPSTQFRNGVSQSMAQSADRVLDRFLNRMPTITIREGTRTKILLTDDLQLPAFDSIHTGGL